MQIKMITSELINYLSNSYRFDDEASENRAKHLRNPVEYGHENGDVAADRHSEGDGWIDVAA